MGCASSIVELSALSLGGFPIGESADSARNISVPERGSTTSTNSASTTASMTSPQSSATQRTVDGFLSELSHLSPKVRASLTDLKLFSAGSFSEETSRPLSLVGLIAALPSASALGEVEHLPSLIGSLARCVRRRGKGAQLRTLEAVQFIYSQCQEGGALHDLQETHPTHVLATCLCCLLPPDTEALMFLRRRTPQIGNNGLVLRTPKHQDGSTLRVSASTRHSLGLIEVLRSSAYFKTLSDNQRASLLGSIMQLGHMHAPKAVTEVLESEAVMKLANENTQAMFLAQVTLLVGLRSHPLRTFTTLAEWCASAIADRQSVTVGVDGTAKFAFAPGDESGSERFAQHHAWMLQYIIGPLFHLWARLAANAELPTQLCKSLAKTIESCRVPLSENATRSRLKFARHDAPVSAAGCPLIRNNAAGVEIPYDTAGMLSVCAMYKINVDNMMFCRRYDDAHSSLRALPLL